LIIAENCLRFAAVDGIGNIFVYFGVVFIGALNGLIGYLILVYTPKYANNMSSPVASVIIIVVVGLSVGSVFMSIYG
jgi:Na+-transporting NADH:ubiquinone oxidoreductase subunit NqrB